MGNGPPPPPPMPVSSFLLFDYLTLLDVSNSKFVFFTLQGMGPIRPLNGAPPPPPLPVNNFFLTLLDKKRIII